MRNPPGLTPMPAPVLQALPLRPIIRETVQDRVYQQLRAMILNGEIKPGQTVTIQSLAEAFQVSAMPVREALRRLLAEQALTALAGRSVGIPALTRERLADLTRVRREVEAMAARWAAQHIAKEDLVALAGLLETMQQAAEERDGKAYLPANRRFHFIIYQAARSPTLMGIIEPLWLQIGPYFDLLRASGNWQSANRAHQAALAALEKGDGEAAGKAIQADIDEAAATLMELLAAPNTRTRA